MQFHFSPFVVDPAKRLLLRDGVPVPLTPKAFDMLLVLLRQRDRVVPKEELLSLLWPDTAVEEPTLSQHLYLLRRALNDSEDGTKYVATIPRRGYRFVAPVIESSTTPVPPGRDRTGALGRWAWTAMIAASIMLAVWFLYFRNADRAAPETVRFTIEPPPGTRFSDVAVSPDGGTMVFGVVGTGGHQLLWTRRLDAVTLHQLRGTEGGSHPFWSPDGREIAFFADGKLKKIAATGEGPPETICDAPDPRGGSWNGENLIVFAPDERGGLYQVSASGGPARPVTTLNPSMRITSQRWPRFMPDGRRFLFVQMAGERERAGIFTGSLDGMTPTRVLSDQSNVEYAAGGYLLFVRGDSLVAQPFDEIHLTASGPAVPVGQGVGRYVSMYAPFAASGIGLLIYQGYDPRSRFVWFDREGHELGTLGDGVRQGDPVVSRDGQSVLSWRGEVQRVDVWSDDLRRRTSSRLTYTGVDILPVWSPNGDAMIFRSNRNGPGDLYLKSLTRTDPEVLLLASSVRKDPTDWSSDGRYLLFDDYVNRNGPDMSVLPLVGPRTPTRYQESPFAKWGGHFSPDGLWVAFVSNETGRPEVYVQAFPAGNTRWRASTEGGDQPQWRADGNELFYLSADGSVTAATVTRRGRSLELGAPRALFKLPAQKMSRLRNVFAAAGDGSRFLVDVPLEDPSTSRLTAVTNWAAARRR